MNVLYRRQQNAEHVWCALRWVRVRSLQDGAGAVLHLHLGLPWLLLPWQVLPGWEEGSEAGEEEQEAVRVQHHASADARCARKLAEPHQAACPRAGLAAPHTG